MPPARVNGEDGEGKRGRWSVLISKRKKRNVEGKKNRRRDVCRVRSFIGSSLRSAERKKKRKEGWRVKLVIILAPYLNSARRRARALHIVPDIQEEKVYRIRVTFCVCERGVSK